MNTERKKNRKKTRAELQDVELIRKKVRLVKSVNTKDATTGTTHKAEKR